MRTQESALRLRAYSVESVDTRTNVPTLPSSKVSTRRPTTPPGPVSASKPPTFAATPTTARRGPSARAAGGDQARVESDLLREIAARDADAFARLYDLVSPRLFGLIRTIVHDRAASEDVLQETMLQIWNKAANFDPSAAHPIVWMMLIARGKAIDHVRRRTSSNAAVMRLATQAPHQAPALRRQDSAAGGDPGTDLGDDSLRLRAARAIDALPTDQRDAIMLAYLGGLTGAEIARHRDVPLGTIKTRIRLGMIRLRETFNRPLEVSA